MSAVTVNGSAVGEGMKHERVPWCVIVVPPLKPIPNMPPGYVEHSRWHDGSGHTTIIAKAAAS